MTHQSHAVRVAAVAKMTAGNPTAPLAQAALALVDPDRVSSAPGVVSIFDRDASDIRNDPNLSEIGKTDRLRNLAASRLLGPLAAVAREFAELQGRHATQKRDALSRATPPADASATLVDLALVAQVKADPKIAFVLERASERVRQALTRMPIELSGISAETQSRVLASLVPGDAAVALGEEAAALEKSRKVVQHCITELQGVARADPDALIRAFGAGWQLPGVLDSLAQALHGQQQAQEAASGAESA